MAAGIDEITQWALTLPVDQRAQVADTLLASLDDSADPADVHETWTSEIAARVDDITSGRVQTISRAEADAQLAADRAARKQRRWTFATTPRPCASFVPTSRGTAPFVAVWETASRWQRMQ